MSATEWQPRPYVVGEENVYVVGVQGIVDAISPDSVTISGHVLPRRMGNGVRLMSMIWPDANPCEREHCTSACDPEPSEAEGDLERLAAIVREQHEDTHNGAMTFCRNRLCREVYDLGVSA